MAPKPKFETLFHESLEDLYDAERQIVAAMPRMIAAASSPKLSEMLQSHLEETRQQVTRLDTIFEQIALEAGTRECRAMQALIEESDRLIENLGKSSVLDAALIAAAQKVEHYEIASYRTACALAELLGQQGAVDMLQDTLEEEMEADDMLIDLHAAAIGGEEEDEEVLDEEELDEDEEDEDDEDEDGDEDEEDDDEDEDEDEDDEEGDADELEDEEDETKEEEEKPVEEVKPKRKR